MCVFKMWILVTAPANEVGVFVQGDLPDRHPCMVKSWRYTSYCNVSLFTLLSCVSIKLLEWDLWQQVMVNMPYSYLTFPFGGKDQRKTQRQTLSVNTALLTRRQRYFVAG